MPSRPSSPRPSLRSAPRSGPCTTRGRRPPPADPAAAHRGQRHAHGSPPRRRGLAPHRPPRPRRSRARGLPRPEPRRRRPEHPRPRAGDALGVVRTEELLQARRLDGGEQLFTRVRDFGYTESLTETVARWGGEDLALGDMVRAIRLFRPLVIVSRFTGTPVDGHGNHQLAGPSPRSRSRRPRTRRPFPSRSRRGCAPGPCASSTSASLRRRPRRPSPACGSLPAGSTPCSAVPTSRSRWRGAASTARRSRDPSSCRARSPRGPPAGEPGVGPHARKDRLRRHRHVTRRHRGPQRAARGRARPVARRSAIGRRRVSRRARRAGSRPRRSRSCARPARGGQALAELPGRRRASAARDEAASSSRRRSATSWRRSLGRPDST